MSSRKPLNVTDREPEACPAINNASPFMPDWPQWLDLSEHSAPETEGIEYNSEQIEQMEKILAYLETEEPTVHGERMQPLNPRCFMRNECCERLGGIFGKLIWNFPQTLIDTLCCFFVSVSDPVPSKQVWLPQYTWEQLMQNQRDVSRDTGCLICFAPALTIAYPFIPPSVGLVIGLNLVLLYAAGIQTFLLVDYGSGEIRAARVSTTGFYHLRKYLVQSFDKPEKDEQLAIENRLKIKDRAKKILSNMRYLIEGMKNAGLTEESLDMILYDFICQLRKFSAYEAPMNQI